MSRVAPPLDVVAAQEDRWSWLRESLTSCGASQVGLDVADERGAARDRQM